MKDHEHYTPRTGKALENLIDRKVREITGEFKNPLYGGDIMSEKNGVVRWRWMIPILLTIASGAVWGGIEITSAAKCANEAKTAAESAMPRSEAYPAVKGARLEVRLETLQRDLTEVKSDVKAILRELRRRRR